jgi:response regulator RpfG family c-di-GMP phosphodiesterase
VSAKILFVDDEPRVLDAIRRLLHGRFDVTLATGAVEALPLLRTNEPFAVIVADMRMPGTNGVEFLDQARQIAPESIRMMLTGNADQQTAVDAVNRGQVFRFLTKPCQPDLLVSALDNAVRQYELQTAERDLLERTLRGSVKALTDVLAVARPDAFGRVDRLRARVREMVATLRGEMTWTLDTAVILSQIGCISVAPDLLDRVARGEVLDADEEAAFSRHVSVGAELIAAIPRLDEVANIVKYQDRNYDGSGPPNGDACAGEAIPLGARLLHAAIAYDRLRSGGWSHRDAVAELRRRRGQIDPALVAVIPDERVAADETTIARVDVDKILVGMTIEEDVRADQGPLLVCRGQEVTPVLRERLQALQRAGTIPKALLVRGVERKSPQAQRA